MLEALAACHERCSRGSRPSTLDTERTHVAEPFEQDDTGWFQRVRSSVLLLVLVGVLGVAAAATTGVVVVGLASLLDHALG